MQVNELYRKENTIIRVLALKDDSVLIIDCIKRQMPGWKRTSDLADYTLCTEEEMLVATEITLGTLDAMSAHDRNLLQKGFALVSGILTYVDDENMRSQMIRFTADKYNVSVQTVRYHLCRYLALGRIECLAVEHNKKEKVLTEDEKNMRWAINKYYYTRFKQTLRTAYTMMLKERYTDENGTLLENYPEFHQFRYFYSKYKKLQTVYISRDGMTDYQRNHRTMLGDGVREFANHVGVGMLDSTICDIYLVNESGSLVGRPIFTACIDAYSGLCCGYMLSWEGGMYALKGLMLNIVADKVEYCKKFGISITKEEWDCDALLGTMATDMGSEYQSENFEHITELGVSLVNLNPYRPDMKSSVEKFFDIIQNLYKAHLKGKGVIEVDFQERGVHDYRRDACLTLEDFEKIIIRCILYYNNSRIVNFDFTKEMIEQGVRANSSSLWQYGKNRAGAHLIAVDTDTLKHCLLARTNGNFTRRGLIVNKLRYARDGYTEQMLRGDNCVVAYNADDVSRVWLLDKGNYVEFALISSLYDGMTLDEVEELKRMNSQHINAERTNNTQARINLAEHIEVITNHCARKTEADISSVRTVRSIEKRKKHIDYMRGDEND